MLSHHDKIHSGGGIAGLTLAISLHRFASPDSPLQVDIYEGDPEVRTVGAGITVWPRTWGVMRHLDLREDLLLVTVQGSAAEALNTDTIEYSKLHTYHVWPCYKSCSTL